MARFVSIFFLGHVSAVSAAAMTAGVADAEAAVLGNLSGDLLEMVTLVEIGAAPNLFDDGDVLKGAARDQREAAGACLVDKAFAVIYERGSAITAAAAARPLTRSSAVGDEAAELARLQLELAGCCFWGRDACVRDVGGAYSLLAKARDGIAATISNAGIVLGEGTADAVWSSQADGFHADPSATVTVPPAAVAPTLVALLLRAAAMRLDANSLGDRGSYLQQWRWWCGRGVNDARSDSSSNTLNENRSWANAAFVESDVVVASPKCSLNRLRNLDTKRDMTEM